MSRSQLTGGENVFGELSGWGNIGEMSGETVGGIVWGVVWGNVQSNCLEVTVLGECPAGEFSDGQMFG